MGKGDPWDRLETPVGTLVYSSEAALRSVTTRCPAVYAALTANARLGEDVCGTVATFA